MNAMCRTSFSVIVVTLILTASASLGKPLTASIGREGSRFTLANARVERGIETQPFLRTVLLGNKTTSPPRHKAVESRGFELALDDESLQISAEDFTVGEPRSEVEEGEVRLHVPLHCEKQGVDYWLHYGITDVITKGVTREQPFMVLFDTYRQYDGWSRLFCLMKRWGETVRVCRENGVSAINAWGALSSGCVWPDWEPGYLTDKDGKPPKVKVSWIGHWNQFRMFTRGFTPGQANVYLLGRLAWDPDTNVKSIARDFAGLSLGAANADAAAEALLATEDAWAEEYVQKTYPVYLKWTMVFNPMHDWMEKAYQNNPLEQVIASNDRALQQVRRMEERSNCPMERYSPYLSSKSLSTEPQGAFRG